MSAGARRRELFVSSVRRRADLGHAQEFPWTLPLVQRLSELTFASPVTFFVGENGSGKSTLLEALAVAAEAVALGGADLRSDPTLAPARALADNLTLVKHGHPKARFFLRAEDVFGFTQRLHRDMRELAQTTSEFAGSRAEGFIAAQRSALVRRYGENPDARSHGETFLALLSGRLVPEGLYFLDEPETPLSPVRVLGLLAMLSDAVAEGSQFVIATHSPILMALPDATLLHFEDGTITPVPYEEVEHVRVTRDFLNAPERYLRRLFEPAEPGRAE